MWSLKKERKNIEKYHDYDFIHEYKDILIEEDNKEQFEWIMPGDEITLAEDDVNVIEELFDSSYPSILNTEDELYFSDDETDILNTAVQFETDDICMSNDNEDDGHLLKSMENDSNTIFNPNLDAINVIQPESCLQNSKELFRKLQLCFDTYENKQGTYDLNMLNELGFRILEKLDNFCPPSTERKALSLAINIFCDKIDEKREADKLFRCKTCNTTFNSEDLLIVHVNNHVSKLTGTYHDYCYNCKVKFSSKELPVQCPNCTKDKLEIDADDENIIEHTEKCSEGSISSPKSKVFPPGTWQKLRQPKDSDAKEMYLPAFVSIW